MSDTGPFNTSLRDQLAKIIDRPVMSNESEAEESESEETQSEEVDIAVPKGTLSQDKSITPRPRVVHTNFNFQEKQESSTGNQSANDNHLGPAKDPSLRRVEIETRDGTKKIAYITEEEFKKLLDVHEQDKRLDHRARKIDAFGSCAIVGLLVAAGVAMLSTVAHGLLSGMRRD